MFHSLAQFVASTECEHSRTQKTISDVDNVNMASTTRVEQNGNYGNHKLNEVTERSSFLVSRLASDELNGDYASLAPAIWRGAHTIDPFDGPHPRSVCRRQSKASSKLVRAP